MRKTGVSSGDSHSGAMGYRATTSLEVSSQDHGPSILDTRCRQFTDLLWIRRWVWYLSTSSRGSDWLLACNTPDGTSPSPHRAWMVVRPKSIGKSPSVAHQLDEAAGSPSLFPKALTRLACPATAGHPRLFDLQFPWTNAAEDEAAIRVSPKRVDILAAKVVLLAL